MVRLVEAEALVAYSNLDLKLENFVGVVGFLLVASFQRAAELMVRLPYNYYTQNTLICNPQKYFVCYKFAVATNACLF